MFPGFGALPEPATESHVVNRGIPVAPVCVECLMGKQKKPILFKVTEPSSVPYRAPPACAKMAAYPDPPPVIPLPESSAVQVNELFEEPHHCKDADTSLTAKAASLSTESQSETCPPRTS
jgi:hypothetical protein